MSSDVAIKVEGLSKVYQIYDRPSDRLKQIFSREKKKYYREFWALNDVSFEINKGETVGIIGRNGSGKSTLLQMICGTLNPTAGSIATNGRIAALLELGSGFNPEFTGRENITLAATLLGLTAQEILECAPEIERFADIGDFIDRPVKTYSSGMFVRLAFSVNIMSNPEIMVVDEALAVGDIAFQAKCMTALKRIQANGATVLFVSHDTNSIKSLCSKAIYLDQGRLMKFDDAPIVAEMYMKIMRDAVNTELTQSSQQKKSLDLSSLKKITDDKALTIEKNSKYEERVAQFRYGTGGARLRYAEITNLDGNLLTEVEFDQMVKIQIYFDVDSEADISVNYYIKDDKKNYILGAGLRTAGVSLIRTLKGERYKVSYLTRMPLHEGIYSIEIQIVRPVIRDQTAEFLDVVDDAILFSMQRREHGRLWSKVYLENQVEIELI